MRFRFRVVAFVCGLFPFLLFGNSGIHEELVIRNIGHHVLLAAGDSSSIVLPIEKHNNAYHINFSSQFAFETTLLTKIVDSVFLGSGLNKSYEVKIVECGKNAIVYGFEVVEEDSLVPCLGRAYPKACYSLIITLHSIEEAAAVSAAQPTDWTHFFLILLILGSAILFAFWWKKKKKKTLQHLNPDEPITRIGAYMFDTKNMFLKYGKQQEELTGKECDLLALLYAHKNETVDRSFILNQVWGDEGDYIGRTLDVFISKLRKKLENDASIRIINIRGVGYKLVLNEPEILT